MSTMKATQATQTMHTVYTGPANTYSKLGTIATKTAVKALWKEGAWVYIEYTVSSAAPNKRRGYVPASEVDIKETGKDGKPVTNVDSFTLTQDLRFVIKAAYGYNGPAKSGYLSSNLVLNKEVAYLGRKESTLAFIEHVVSGTQKTRVYCDPNNLGYYPSYKDYLGNDILSEEMLKNLLYNKHFYEKSGKEHGVPWQMIAAIHYRENKLVRSGPDNTDGPYQIWNSNYKVGNYTDSEFQFATDKAAEFIKQKADEGKKTLSVEDDIKYTFFAYNGGRADYTAQATKLGYGKTQAANGEGSPYVMNRADKKRDPTVEPTKSNKTWGQVKNDGGIVEYPANTDYGAFIVYKALLSFNN